MNVCTTLFSPAKCSPSPGQEFRRLLLEQDAKFTRLLDEKMAERDRQAHVLEQENARQREKIAQLTTFQVLTKDDSPVWWLWGSCGAVWLCVAFHDWIASSVGPGEEEGVGGRFSF